MVVLLALVLAGLAGGVAWADVNNFYFSDFTGDYYLSRDEEGVSHLRVKESVTAVFPDYAQNKGICRQIPFTNQGGVNVTLPKLTRDNLKLTRNGAAEPIYSIERENGYYNVCTGTEEYVMGEQTYVFEYEFEKVVTEFEGYQELYWDTNGTGARQRFDKVTARLHFENEDVGTGKSWCYVGRQGENGRNRCGILEISDGVEFRAKNLAGYENLTFDAELKEGSFVVPGPDKNYTYVWLTVGVGVLCLLIVGWGIRKFTQTREKARYYKEFFVKPEYQPHAEYALPEMVEIYIGKKKDIKVAMLLDLVVNKKIEFQKVDKKKWNIAVRNLDCVRGEYMELLAILNGGERPEVGDIVELKRRSANNRLMRLKKSMEDKIRNDLSNAELIEEGYRFGSSDNRGVANVVAMSIAVIPVVVALGAMLMSVVEAALGLDETYGQEMVFYPYAMILVTVPVAVALSDAAQKYEKHTLKGLEASRYMDGLKLYIGMAEAERMKMLQSVKGADTSAEGIVKLYEKLLPYTAVFGLEESWMDEMREYCKVEELQEPDYLLTGITVAEMSRGLRTAASYATTATSMSSSSGGSGGGGGGFSGGGGGGGGFSGR